MKAFRTQLADGTSEADALRLTYSRLQGKLAETRAQCEVMLAQHQRAHLVARATEARAPERSATGSVSPGAIGRVQARIDQAEAENLAHETLLPTESLEAKFAKLELDDRVEQLLADLKSKGKHLLPTG